MSKIIAPNNQYSGISAGVSFVNGIGETADPKLIAWFREKGYKVENVSRETKEDPPIGDPPVVDPKPKTRNKREVS